MSKIPGLRSVPVLVALLLVLPSVAGADPIEIDLDNIGPRWLGVQYIDNLGWHMQSPGDLNGDGLDDLAVSAPQDVGPVTFHSTVRIFFGRPDGPPESGAADWADVEVTDGKVGTDAVFQFAFIPDATGDGVRDLLVAEPNASKAGKVLLYSGADWSGDLGAPDSVARWDGYIQEETTDMAPETRPSLVAAGDFDGDSVADIVIASGLFNRVWIDYSDAAYTGTISLRDVPDFLVQCADEVPTAQFASAMTVGNFNDDNFDDLAVSAPGCDDDEGHVYVWYGEAGGLPAVPDLDISNGDRLGGSLMVLDLNADGVDDLAIQELLTAVAGDPGHEGRGNLWIHLGSVNGLVAGPDVRVLGGVSDKRFGARAAILADISNPADGLPELVVGAPESAFGGTGQGAVHVFEGRADWSGDVDAAEARYRVVGSHMNAWFGHSLATLDDFDGDGYPEIAIGEPNFTDGDGENDFHRGRFYLMTALPDRDEDNDGFSTLNGDCDDTDETVSPIQLEECGDGIDNDCDHEVDEGCGDDDDAADDDDDDATANPPGDDDDDDATDCDCNSSLADAGPITGAWMLLLGGLVAIRRRR
jgi:MYXO-CTERM domain-containing protein